MAAGCSGDLVQTFEAEGRLGGRFSDCKTILRSRSRPSSDEIRMYIYIYNLSMLMLLLFWVASDVNTIVLDGFFGMGSKRVEHVSI